MKSEGQMKSQTKDAKRGFCAAAFNSVPGKPVKLTSLGFMTPAAVCTLHFNIVVDVKGPLALL